MRGVARQRDGIGRSGGGSCRNLIVKSEALAYSGFWSTILEYSFFWTCSLKEPNIDMKVYTCFSLVTSKSSIENPKKDPGFLIRFLNGSFRKLRGSLFSGPYNKDPTVLFRVLS